MLVRSWINTRLTQLNANPALLATQIQATFLTTTIPSLLKPRNFSFPLLAKPKVMTHLLRTEESF